MHSVQELANMKVGELRHLIRSGYPECRGRFASDGTREEYEAILTEKHTPGEVMAIYRQRIADKAAKAAKDAIDKSVAKELAAIAALSPAGDEKAADDVVAGDAISAGDAMSNELAARVERIEAAEAEKVKAEPDLVIEAIDRVLPSLKGLNAAAAEAIEKLVAEHIEGKKVSTPDLTVNLVPNGVGEVKIGGVMVPMVSSYEAMPNGCQQCSDDTRCVTGTGGCKHYSDRLKYHDCQDAMKHVPLESDSYRFDYWRACRQCGAVTFEQDAEDVIKLLLADMRIMLVGPPGVGKTSIIEQFAARCNWPLTRFNGNRDVTSQDFVGNYEARDGSTEWVDGPLPRAMKAGHIFIIDEADHMPAECSSIAHSVLEKGGRLLITGNGGEVVKPHANFRMIATANTAGFGDVSGIHANAQVQDAAFLDRFDCVFRVTYMKPENERALLQESGATKEVASDIVKVAEDTRKAQDHGDMLYPITLRQSMAWASLTPPLGFATAFAIAVLNKVPHMDVAAVAEIAQRHLGRKLGGKLISGD